MSENSEHQPHLHRPIANSIATYSAFCCSQTGVELLEGTLKWQKGKKVRRACCALPENQSAVTPMLYECRSEQSVLGGITTSQNNSHSIAVGRMGLRVYRSCPIDLEP